MDRTQLLQHFDPLAETPGAVWKLRVAEQQRMVAKGDEWMRWCDALEARFTAAQTTVGGPGNAHH